MQLSDGPIVSVQDALALFLCEAYSRMCIGSTGLDS